MKAWPCLLGYQLVWLAAITGAGRGIAWPGLAAAALFLGWQLASRHPRRNVLAMMGLGFVLGCVVDGALSASGAVEFSAADWTLPGGGAPLWILALWACFAVTIEHGMSFLLSRPWLGMVFGAIGGPVAYLGAERGWQAVHFLDPRWQPLLGLAVGWALAVPLMTLAARQLATRTRPTTTETRA